MRIGIDGTLLGLKRTGIGRYVYELCKELDKVMPEATFYIYSNKKIDMPVISNRWILREERSWFIRNLKAIIWLKFFAGNRCNKDEIDIFWGCGTFLPHFKGRVRTISTVYDLNLYLAPKTMAKSTYLVHKLFYKADVNKAHSLVAISTGTAQKIKQKLNKDVSAIVLPSVSLEFKRPSVQKLSTTLSKYKIYPPYLLAVGTQEPRKNLTILINAFARIKNIDQFKNHTLVLVGASGWRNSEFQEAFNKNQKNDIRLLGYIENEDLPAIYSGADIFIFPSIYEGFGIPVLEARACGARILASDIDEVREAGGVGPLYIKPTEQNIVEALINIKLNNNQGQSNSNNFASWRDGAQIMRTIFEKLNA